MSFHVGQRVICILNEPWMPQPGLIQFPFWNGVYTVAEVRVIGNDIGLRLFEVSNPIVKITKTGEMREPAFDAQYFRPIVERKTDISCLKALLVPEAKILEGVE